MTDGTDVQISTGFESEMSVAVSPLNSDVVLVSGNTVNGTTAGLSGWISTDGGSNWNSTSVPQGGDPTCVISRYQKPGSGSQYGRFLIGHNDGGPQACAYRDVVSGGSWTDVVVLSPGPFDKPNLWVDNWSGVGSQPFIYDAFITVGEVIVQNSVNSGTSWSATQPVTHTSSAGRWSPVVRTNDLGHVYVVWSNTTGSGSQNEGAVSIGFIASTNQGLDWSPEVPAAAFPGGLDCCDLASNTMPVTTYPSMAVDRDTGNIYIVFARRVDVPVDEITSPTVPPQAPELVNVVEIFVFKGNPTSDPLVFTWEQPQRISQATSGERWHPWIDWDDCTGALVVVFHDSRADETKMETWVAVSLDEAASWDEFRVSDAQGSGDWPDCHGTGIEYIGVATADGKAYPVWADDRSSNSDYRSYTSPFLLWGILQSTVAESVSHRPSYKTDVRVSWSTNLGAGVTKAVTITSPSGVDYECDASTSCVQSTNKFNHFLDLKNLTCEVGTWTYTVEIEKTGCESSRVSEQKTFKVKNCLN